MLNAILHGKRRGTGTEGVLLSDEFNGLEDTLTATVFERIFYLPDELVVSILFAKDIWDGSSTAPSTSIEKIDFWPRLTADGEAAIEPDIVIEFGDRVLVIEAKRWDFVGRQDPAQLAREYARAYATFPGKQVWLLAVGGLPDGRKTTKIMLHNALLDYMSQMNMNPPDGRVKFAATAWHNLFRIVDVTIGDAPRHQRLISDMREGLILHGIGVERPCWLSELVSSEWRAATGRIKTPLASFTPKWAAQLARFQPITTTIEIFCREERG